MPPPFARRAVALLALVATVSPSVRAGAADDVAQLKALAFAEPTDVQMAPASAPAKNETGTFHGCALRSEWKLLAGPARTEVVTALQTLIASTLASSTRAHPHDNLVHLQPLGMVYGNVALRMKTSDGSRDFALALGQPGATTYVYAYAGKHRWCFVLDPANADEQAIVTKLRHSLITSEKTGPGQAGP
jgi:hypothetical protein